MLPACLQDVDPLEAIELELDEDEDAPVYKWFYDNKPLQYSKMVNGPSYKKWKLPLPVMSTLYRLAGQVRGAAPGVVPAGGPACLFLQSGPAVPDVLFAQLSLHACPAGGRLAEDTAVPVLLQSIPTTPPSAPLPAARSCCPT